MATPSESRAGTSGEALQGPAPGASGSSERVRDRGQGRGGTGNSATGSVCFALRGEAGHDGLRWHVSLEEEGDDQQFVVDLPESQQVETGLSGRASDPIPQPPASAAPPQGDAAAAKYTIRTSQGYVARIGAFRIRRDPTIRAAARVFGRRRRGSSVVAAHARSIGAGCGCGSTSRTSAGLHQARPRAVPRSGGRRASRREAGGSEPGKASGWVIAPRRSLSVTTVRSSGAGTGGCGARSARSAMSTSTRSSRQSSQADEYEFCADGSAQPGTDLGRRRDELRARGRRRSRRSAVCVVSGYHCRGGRGRSCLAARPHRRVERRPGRSRRSAIRFAQSPHELTLTHGG